MEGGDRRSQFWCVKFTSFWTRTFVVRRRATMPTGERAAAMILRCRVIGCGVAGRAVATLLAERGPRRHRLRDSFATPQPDRCRVVVAADRPRAVLQALAGGGDNGGPARVDGLEGGTQSAGARCRPPLLHPKAHGLASCRGKTCCSTPASAVALVVGALTEVDSRVARNRAPRRDRFGHGRKRCRARAIRSGGDRRRRRPFGAASAASCLEARAPLSPWGCI